LSDIPSVFRDCEIAFIIVEFNQLEKASSPCSSLLLYFPKGTFDSDLKMFKRSLKSDGDQGEMIVEEREVSEKLFDKVLREIMVPKKSSVWKSADAHRGEPKLDPSSDDMMRFTATGRPFVPDDRYQSTWAGLDSGDSFTGVPGKTLPFKYTDDSLISVPCLRLGIQESAPASGEPNDTKKKWWRRKSSSSSNPDNFEMKKVRRGEYLKHYAKDDQGNYCGTEEPAEDCILRGKDLERYRSNRAIAFRNEIAENQTDYSALMGVEKEKEKDDGVIR
jgi:hypothetical protein